MATITLEVTPTNTVQRTFSREVLLLATHNKVASIRCPPAEASANMIATLLWSAVSAMALDTLNIGNTQVSNIRLRLADAIVAIRGAPAVIGPGQHLLVVQFSGDADQMVAAVPIRAFIDEPPEVPEHESFATLVAQGKITFSNARVRGVIQQVQHFMDKAASIYERGVAYTGHGLTNSIKAYHAHVNNDQALGFKWVEGNLHIVGIGEKSDAARHVQGTSGYDWRL